MTLTLTSVNVNGISAAVKERSEANRGFLPWLEETTADVILLQEVRATEDQTRKALEPALDQGWFYVGAEAAAKGRAGVGILSRRELTDIHIGVPGFEDSGRFIRGTLVDDDITVASLYLPSGSADTTKQDEKYYFLDVFEDELATLAAERENVVVSGDWNICHRRDDLKNWKANQKKSGFLPDERAWMDSLLGVHPDEESQIEAHGDFLGAVDYVAAKEKRVPCTDPQWFDISRRLNPEQTDYTWWSFRGKAFDNNAGWRIDYQIATRSMLERAMHAHVERADAHELRWSDHAPLTVTYE